MIAKLRGEAYPFTVWWYDKNGRSHLKQLHAIRGTTHRLSLPRTAVTYDIALGGHRVYKENVFSLGPWYPEVPNSDALYADPDQQTWVDIRRGSSLSTCY